MDDSLQTLKRIFKEELRAAIGFFVISAMAWCLFFYNQLAIYLLAASLASPIFITSLVEAHNSRQALKKLKKTKEAVTKNASA